MVNYDAVTIGLEVEFVVDSKICRGKIRYKGGINGKEGLWLGIESNEPVGYCDGRLMGRFYFKCPDNYGLFLTADELRLVPHLPRKRKNTLHKSIKSECDELLFRSTMPEQKITCITEDYLRRAKSSFGCRYDDIFANQPKYISKSYLVYKPKEASTASDSKNESSFHRQSSIQRTFMPKDEMKLYTKLNWSYKNVSLPRNTDLSNTFDSFNKKRSNYIGKDM